MGDVKRWTVTYTKHVKQKRKVYQDGLLEIHSSSRKVVLYDDCEKLLDGRFMKTDDIIRSGETLTFDAYLVDIGDPHGDHKPIPNLNFQESDKKINEKAGSLHRRNFKTNSISLDDRKANSGMNKASLHNLSPSQKIIREFKRSEISKYGVSPSSPDTTKTSIAEWQVLYTTQMTQKAKRFHDGILKVATTGLQGTQVMLYDTTRRLLDSRFLKKDEIIRSGESLTFDGHLVDIGEREGDHELNVEGRNCNVVGKTGILHGQQVQTHNNYPAEWEAMYTTQITQKTKKYHSGILRLASCGSYRMQVTLLTEDGATLGRRYLESSKHISTGSTLELPKYLVEVGEPRKHPEGGPQSSASARKDKESNVKSPGVDNTILSRRVSATKPLCDGESQKNASPCKGTDPNVRSSGADNIKSSRRAPTNRPLRDAHAILSILKKPATLEGIATMKRASVEECNASQSAGFVHCDVQGQPMQDSCSKIRAMEDHDEETTTMHNNGGEILRSKAVHNDILIETIKSADSDNKGDSQPKNHAPSSFSFGSEASRISSRVFDVECSDNSRTRPVSTIVEPQVLDALNLDSDGQPATASVPQNGNVKIENFCELMSSKVTSSLSSSKSSKEVKPGNTSQPCADNTGIDDRCHGASGFDVATSSERKNRDTTERKKFEKQRSTRVTDECPSFDLGF